MTQPRLEVAEVFRDYGDAFLDRYGDTLSPEQRRALRDIAACRTAALGGHVEECTSAAISRSPITRAATATAPSARPPPRRSGWRRGKRNCSRSSTITSSLLSRRCWARLPCKTWSAHGPTRGWRGPADGGAGRRGDPADPRMTPADPPSRPVVEPLGPTGRSSLGARPPGTRTRADRRRPRRAAAAPDRPSARRPSRLRPRLRSPMLAPRLLPRRTPPRLVQPVLQHVLRMARRPPVRQQRFQVRLAGAQP